MDLADGRASLDPNTPRTPRHSSDSYGFRDMALLSTPYRSSSKHRSSNNIALLSRSSSLLGDGRNASAPPSPSPPPLSSPSVVSSLASSSHHNFSYSPLRRELSQAPHDDGARGQYPNGDSVQYPNGDSLQYASADSLQYTNADNLQYTNRDAAASLSRSQLARRLRQLAQRLAPGGGVEDVDDETLSHQVAQMEAAIELHASGSGSGADSGPHPASVASPACDAFDSSPASSPSLFRSRYSDLSASLQREREAERQLDLQEPPPQMGMTVPQANKIIAELAKLNDELSAVINNLRARQEESDHIHGLLVERAERAAQRILWLQQRISYFEHELRENDDELQHLRICLKAVECQMPPHPDQELQRCIARFKQDYQALKEKRAARATCLAASFYDSPSGTIS